MQRRLFRFLGNVVPGLSSLLHSGSRRQAEHYSSQHAQGKERPAASRDHSPWLPCVGASCVVVRYDLLVLCGRAPLSRFRHAKNQISYDPTGSEKPSGEPQ